MIHEHEREHYLPDFCYGSQQMYCLSPRVPSGEQTGQHLTLDQMVKEHFFHLVFIYKFSFIGCC